MTELLTAAEVRAIEQAAIDSGDVTGLELMERAGEGAVEAVFEEWPELGQGTHRAVVLCGPGNNGGDGFVVARLLKERGWEVEVFLYGDPAKLPPDAKTNYERWSGMGAVRDFLSTDAARHIDVREGEDGILVDALFGTGLSRGLDTPARLALDEFSSRVPLCRLKYVAVDVPSGVCSDSGKWLTGPDGIGSARHSDLTVTFHRPRLGHYLEDVRTRSLRVKSIGLDDAGRRQRERKTAESMAAFTEILGTAEGSAEALRGKLRSDMPAAMAVDCNATTVELIQGVVSMIGKAEPRSHKYSHGHALILAGGFGKTGAARLAARGALRIGAGLVTLGAPGSAQMEVASQITALMLTRVEDGDALAEVLQDDRINALCLGPGLGLDRARELVPAAVRADHAPSVLLDADALTAFADDPDALFPLLHEGCVLTPHGGEFARLFPDIAERLREAPMRGPAYSKVDATREAAKRAGCVVLYKGPDTVIADPEGRASVNAAVYDREAPWLATAGAGDVLAGFITGLLARGFPPMQAAETAAWLHVECARSFGAGLIAEDLPEALPQVFRGLGI